MICRLISKTSDETPFLLDEMHFYRKKRRRMITTPSSLALLKHPGNFSSAE
jgi:hypothetical protein